MTKALKIASVCRALPTPDDPACGLFVMRRLEAMSRVADLKVFQPIPWFPMVNSLQAWAKQRSHESLGVLVEHAPMFYVPKFFKGLDSYWLYRSIRERLALLKANGELDLVDAHFAYPDGVGSLRVAEELGVPAFITMRGVEEDYLKIPVIARQIKAALRSVDGCICVSHSLRDAAVTAGVDPQRVAVIHNAVNRTMFQPRDRATAKRILGVDCDTRIIVSVGNLLSVKRHDVLIQALAQLDCNSTTVRLVIIGGTMHESAQPAALRKLCDDLGVTDRVTFTGRLAPADVANWLDAADVFALASRREGCCNAVLEALASGTPVVATAVGDNERFVHNGTNGYIVPVDNSTAMSQAIGTVLEREEWDRDHISRLLEVGDWDRVATDVMEFLASCLAMRRTERDRK